MEEKKKMKSNTEEDYNKVLASEDPTNISKEEQERLTREAIKKLGTILTIHCRNRRFFVHFLLKVSSISVDNSS
ncbi:MAG: hypothetical protein AUI60_03625 [Thaumarchaeota archaeon 13_1_40CM_2_39_4]|nr:MAG: hypothetical protein AUI60_03625 [Thaumarchaeota archaeon 13_1_40CM_2_39_4]